ncbi:hypothetical protein [Hymenobacter psoromatis]|uniref:hypothetical protein n=1 Tax=Hymenobacter psoromatis TaxID=1484116 RepID=UPI001CBF3F46|nr:hypothetical protein [Hymenobacter psoromatis]
MKNSLSLAWLALLCFGLLAGRPATLVVVKLDERVSVLFPTQPQETAVPAPAKMRSAHDASGTYQVTISPIGAAFQGAQRKHYFDSVVEGARKSSNGTVQERSPFTLSSYEGIDFTLLMGGPDTSQAKLVFFHCLLVDQNSYVLQFIPAPGTPPLQAQRRSEPFFQSIRLTPVAK